MNKLISLTITLGLAAAACGTGQAAEQLPGITVTKPTTTVAPTTVPPTTAPPTIPPTTAVPVIAAPPTVGPFAADACDYYSGVMPGSTIEALSKTFCLFDGQDVVGYPGFCTDLDGWTLPNDWAPFTVPVSGVGDDLIMVKVDPSNRLAGVIDGFLCHGPL